MVHTDQKIQSAVFFSCFVLWKVGACNYSLGPQLTLPAPLFLPVLLFARSQVKAIIFLLGVGLVSWMEPSPLLGQPLAAAAALQAPSFAVPISTILQQSGRKHYLLGLVLGGGGPWRRGSRLQVLWAQRKAQGVQQLMVWTDFRVQSGNRKGCLGTVFRGTKREICLDLKIGRGEVCLSGSLTDKRSSHG